MARRKQGKSEWQTVEVDPNVLASSDAGSFVSFKELTDYEILDGKIITNRGHDEKGETSGTSKKTKRKRNRRRKKSKTNAEIEDTPCDNDLGTAHVKESKKKKIKTTTAKHVEILHADANKELCMDGWKDLHVPGPVLHAMRDKGYSAPTPIQALCLPSAIRDRMDIVGAAETGSGKTLAFGIPLITHIMQLKEQQEKSIASSSTEIGETCELPKNSDKSRKDDNAHVDDYDDSEFEDYDDDDDDVSSDISIVSDIGSSSDNINMTDEEEEIEKRESDSSCSEQEQDDDGSDLTPDEDECCPDDDPSFHRASPTPSQPIVTKSAHKQARNGPLYAIVVTPTRELAIQVQRHLKDAAKYTDINIATVVGGMSSQKQERLLKYCPEIVVATPGRLWELIQQHQPHLSKANDIRFLVIDEADRMIEKGHFQELTSLLDHINCDLKEKQRQTFVFSATLTMVHSLPQRLKHKKKRTKQQAMTEDMKLESLMQKIGVKVKAKVINLSTKSGTAESLLETRINCSVLEKDLYLYYLVTMYPGRTLVFTNSKDCLRRLVSVLTLLNCNPLPLHADMHQKQRLKNLDRFKDNARGLLLATDVAARGIDIPNVQHVVHYQVPSTTENYVHRSGRTARAENDGVSVMLIGPEDMKYYKRIIHTLNRDEEIAVFPMSMQHVAAVKQRVTLAQQIDKEEHKVSKLEKQNNWFRKAAEDMDIDIQEANVLHDLGDSGEQLKHKNKIRAMKSKLNSLLTQPLNLLHGSTQYLTQSGKLQMPYVQVDDANSAANAIKTDQRKIKEKKQIKQQTQQQTGAKRKRQRAWYNKAKRRKNQP